MMDSQKQMELLKKSGLKVTRQREAILEMLLSSPSHLTAEDIFLHLKSMGEPFGLSTVYRTLTSLEEHHIIEKTGFPDSDKQYFNIAHTGHRHHLVCTKCKQCIVIDECPVEKFTAEACEQYGFQMTGHSFEIFGICPKCQK